MAVSYNKLWKILIDRKMSKTQLVKEANISTNAMAKLGRDEDVRVEVLVKICNVLECTIDDIMDILPKEEVKELR
ncbi:MAG: helix-turn-helix transcriptional regulator [Mogibacterium sp.]|nr:helix-turn-helix transcriptional regulator [Mogibacterium sp.]